MTLCFELLPNQSLLGLELMISCLDVDRQSLQVGWPSRSAFEPVVQE